MYTIVALNKDMLRRTGKRFWARYTGPERRWADKFFECRVMATVAGADDVITIRFTTDGKVQNSDLDDVFIVK